MISYDVGHAKSYDVVGAVKSYCWVSVGPCDWYNVKSDGGGCEMYRWCLCWCIEVFGQYGYCTGLFWSRTTMIPGCAKNTSIVAYVECLSICHLT